MSNLYRLGRVAAGLLALASMGQVAIAHGATARKAPVAKPYYTFQRVVYQNNGGWPDDKAYFNRLLRNIGAHIVATDGKVEIRVVNFASGINLFLLAKQDAELAKVVDDLRAKGVRFLICKNTIERMKLAPTDLYGVQDADIVPSGVAEIARLQGMGYVYLHP